ncbi:flagellar protein FlaG [Marinomonas ostreistagni]|uniref:Flagellar protein FlaG n=1 Tax=Marinomonas ostreistagni TaxID=359209 RepID=A0ABS0Z627_9GAMM|nr:flagellar protein FlaG [Marinomonas ostreistagni]MBJ7549119.1 flagellar protein FlaG [Marinomonas ostreistagni]
MSISSDFSRSSLSSLQTGQQTQVSEQEFVEAKQKESQVIKQSADISNTSEDSKSGNDLASSESSSSQELVDEAKMEEVNVKMRQLSVGLSFEMTEDGSDNIVKVVDQETGDLVRQIPSEEFLEMSKRLDSIFGELTDLKGNLINSEV